MASVPVAPSTEAPTSPHRPSANVAWQPVLWFAALLIVCYAPILYRMGVQWATDENMGHGFFVPVIAGWIAWQRKDQLLATPAKQNAWGLVLVVWAGLQALAATLGAELLTAMLA